MNYLIGNDFLNTLTKYPNRRDLLFRRLREFLEMKTVSPHNGSSPEGTKFGETDKRFKSKGLFASKIQDISHAHLTHDISIVYRVKDDVLYLYGIYSHDAIGTGMPPNTNRQKQMATRWSKTKFTSLDPSSLVHVQKQPARDSNVKPKINDVRSAQSVIKPNQKSVRQHSPQDHVLAAAKIADTKWSNRKLYSRMKQANTREQRLDIIEAEINYLHRIASRNTLYPNQQRYVKNLADILKILTSQR